MPTAAEKIDAINSKLKPNETTKPFDEKAGIALRRLSASRHPEAHNNITLLLDLHSPKSTEFNVHHNGSGNPAHFIYKLMRDEFPKLLDIYIKIH